LDGHEKTSASSTAFKKITNPFAADIHHMASRSLDVYKHDDSNLQLRGNGFNNNNIICDMCSSRAHVIYTLQLDIFLANLATGYALDMVIV